MALHKLTVRDVDVRGRRVLVRVDFNVPIDEQGNITNDTRIRASLPTIKYLLDEGAAVILMSHLGRPKGRDPRYSLAPVATRLQELLGPDVPVKFVNDCIGLDALDVALHLQPGEVLLLENVRFHPEEEANDPVFARQLAELADVYVNDAFGSAHRAHASTEGVTRYLPSVAGLLMERELNMLGSILESPERPFVAVLGGAKISDKIGVIGNLLDKVDTLVIGGGMANTFLKALDFQVGRSLLEEDRLKDAEALVGRAELQGVRLLLPRDVVFAREVRPDAEHRVVDLRSVPEYIAVQGWRIVDIGPETADHYGAVIREARTVFWNGPMGIFEMPPFDAGTRAVARAMCDATRAGATTVVGGGDSVAAIEQMGLGECITHISTGGGASLEVLEGRILPGVAALMDRPE